MNNKQLAGILYTVSTRPGRSLSELTAILSLRRMWYAMLTLRTSLPPDWLAFKYVLGSGGDDDNDGRNDDDDDDDDVGDPG